MHCTTVFFVLFFTYSQTSAELNETVPDALVLLKELVASDKQILVKHQTGIAMLEQVKGNYKAVEIKAEVNAFIEDIVMAYQWADLVICRAGAMTVSEVAAMGVPAILIPLPSAIDDHQTANAHFLSDVGAAVILPQKELNPHSLAVTISNLLEQLPEMSLAIKKCAFLDATSDVANYCIAEAVQ